MPKPYLADSASSVRSLQERCVWFNQPETKKVLDNHSISIDGPDRQLTVVLTGGLRQKLSLVLSSVAFRFPAVRIALEVSLALVLFCLLNFGLRSVTLVELFDERWRPLFVWALVSSTISALDLALFYKPLNVYEGALQCEILAAYDKAQ